MAQVNLGKVVGNSAYEDAVIKGYSGTLDEWLKSLVGDSAYEEAVKKGYGGTEDEWLESLRGKSAYELAVANGFVGSEVEWLAMLNNITTVNHGVSDTTFELTPNVLHVWGEVTSLTLTLSAVVKPNVTNEYLFQFTSGGTATTLGLPSSLKWIGEKKIEANKVYQVSILNGVAVLGGAK